MSGGLQVWSQTAASNSNADSTINWAEGQAPSSVNDSARALMASMAKWRDDNNGTLATTGSSAAYTATSNQTAAALTDGYSVTLRFHATVNSSATLAVDSLTAKPIQIYGGCNISFGQIRKGSVRTLTYSSTGTGQWILQGAPHDIPGSHRSSYSFATPGNDELLCDGTPYSRTTYADLFAAIGTVHGSSDSSTFRVPDAMGRVLAGKEATATRLTTAVGGVDGGTIGAVGGVQSVTLTTATLPAHSHTATDSGHTHSYNAPVSSGFTAPATGGSVTDRPGSATATAAGTASITVGSAGDGGAHANVQPTIVVNHFIKI